MSSKKDDGSNRGEKLGLYISTLGILSGAVALGISALATRKSVNEMKNVSGDIQEKLSKLEGAVRLNESTLRAMIMTNNGLNKDEMKTFEEISSKLKCVLEESMLEGPAKKEDTIKELKQLNIELQDRLADFDKISGKVWELYHEGVADGSIQARHRGLPHRLAQT
jgi:hypothetical protein